MNLILDPSDLIRLRERNGAIAWWISEEFLIRILKGLTELYLRKVRHFYAQSITPTKRIKDILPDTGKAWRYARKNGRFYYCLDNIPDVAPTFYKSRLPGPKELETLMKSAVKSDRLKELEILVKDRLERISIGYRCRYYGYTTERMVRLANACAALELCIEIGRERDMLERGVWYRDFGAALDRIGIMYLPTNWRRLKEKTDAVLTGGTQIHEAIDLPRRENQNARKLDDMEVESWIVQMRGMGQNFTNAHIARKVRQMCELTGKKQPSKSWIAQMLAAPAVKFLTSAGRYGERGRKGQVYRQYTPIANALFADDCWQVDGTRVNFIPWKNQLTGREEFLYMVTVRDVHSGLVIGCSFGLTEDRYAYINALRMACSITRSLPYELVIDRFPGHNTEEWQTIQGRMEAIGVRVSYKHTATGKAQLERWFETLQSVFFQESAYYYGEGIQSTRQAAHRSAEYLKAIRKIASTDGWNQDTATREAIKCISRYNETALNEYSRKHAAIEHSPKQLYAISPKPHCKTVADWQRTMLFGLEKTVGIRNGIIKTDINKVEYMYEVSDYDTLKNHRTVAMVYDPENLDTVWLFAQDENRRHNPLCLGEAQRLDRVQIYGPGADYKSLGRDNGRRNRIEKQRLKEVEQIKQAGSEVNLMLAGMGTKSEAEKAETAYWLEEVENIKLPVLNAGSKGYKQPGEGDDDDFDIASLVLAQM